MLVTNSVTVTIRLIRSFEHRNIKHLVLRDVNPQCTVQELMNRIDNGTCATCIAFRIVLQIYKSVRVCLLPSKSTTIVCNECWFPFVISLQKDCIKINSHAHGSKVSIPNTCVVLCLPDQRHGYHIRAR